MSHPFAFLVESYQTEGLKTLTVWSEFADADLAFRPAPRCRTPLEQMVHQCVSEDGWMTKIPLVGGLLEAEAQGGDWPPLPGPGAASPTERP